MPFEALKVGELAKRTGLTVRTLHHSDEIGLLRPSLHTEAGHRLYTAADVARLQRVLSLRQLGFSLEEVRDCLTRPGFSPLEVIRLHVTRLRLQQDSAFASAASRVWWVAIGGGHCNRLPRGRYNEGRPLPDADPAAVPTREPT